MAELDTKKIDEAFELINRDLYRFGYAFCSDLISGEIPKFHVELCELLTKEERLVLAAPRGFSKSCWVSKVYPLWCAVLKKKRDIVIISASEALALEHLRYIKQKLEQDQFIIGAFGDLRSDKWSESHLILKHRDGSLINIRAKGAGGQIRGFRPDCIILDDIETDESVTSEEQRKKLKNWFYTACINCLLPGGQLILIGTIIHPLSVLADVLETPNNWVKRKWQAYKDGIEKEGNELWKKSRPHSWLQQRKAEIGSFAFASEYMNNPMLNDRAPIKQDQIRYWTELPKQYSCVISVDPAYSEEDKSDFKVASLVGIDHNLNRYLINYIRTHEPVGEFIDAILNMFTQNRGLITGVGIPTGGTEKMFMNSVLKRAAERKIYPPFVELKNTFITSGGQKVREKTARITACLQPLFEQGKYYIHENHYEVRDELLTIGSSRWDDLVDTLAYAEQILQPYYEHPKVTRFDERGYLIEEDKTRENYGF